MWLILFCLRRRRFFLQLENDRDRDLFIEAFWRQRDPTPGTPENEYKDEHIRRFNYANKFYGRSTTREGWRTDMGRIYIILGEPVSIERFESSNFIVPCQAWSYYGDPKKELPPHFVLFFSSEEVWANINSMIQLLTVQPAC